MQNIKVLLMIVSLIAVIVVCTACTKNKSTSLGDVTPVPSEISTPVPQEENEVIETNIKGNEEKSKEKLEEALDVHFKDAFDVRADDVVITRLKVFSPEEEASDERLANLHLMEEEIAFEVEYDVHPAPGVDPTVFTFSNGDIDGEWVRNKYNCGILRLNEEGQYRISSIGTSF